MNPSISITSRLPWQATALLAAALTLAPVSRALVFDIGDIKANFDTTLSVGGLLRMDNPSRDLIGLASGGTQRSNNADDGNLNYKGHELASFLVKANHDLQLTYKNAGGFVRAFYFNDFVNTNGGRARTALNNEALDIVGKDIELLDAYVYLKGEIGDMPARISIGRQVLSWGESTFIPNGINSVNPIDVAKLRTPGSELKEALRPLNMISASISATENLTLDAFYLLDWERTRVDPPGTYFSGNDFVAKGGSKVYLGFGAIPDTASFGFVQRGTDREPGHSGQWGAAARYLAASLNDTEFTFYVMNYHSRLPTISAQTPTAPINGPLAAANTAAALQANSAFIGSLAAAVGPANVPSSLTTLIGAALTSVPQAALPAVLQPFYPTVQPVAGAFLQQEFFRSVATARYLIEFPEDIKLYGVGFNTSWKGIALQGEVVYRQRQPLQIDDVELLFAALGSINPAFAANNQMGNFSGQLNTYVRGYRRFDVWQAQLTATKTMGGILGADQTTLLGEVGYTTVPDLPSKSVLRFDGPATFVGGSLAAMTATGNGASGSDPADAFADKTSWGYQVLMRLDYNNAFNGVNVSPLMVFTHDVSGNTPLPLGNFREERKSFTLGAEFTYQNAWSFDLRYVNFFGAGRFNLLGDRDYVSATLKYSF